MVRTRLLLLFLTFGVFVHKSFQQLLNSYPNGNLYQQAARDPVSNILLREYLSNLCSQNSDGVYVTIGLQRVQLCNKDGEKRRKLALLVLLLLLLSFRWMFNSSGSINPFSNITDNGSPNPPSPNPQPNPNPNPIN